jgi:hypothetical protein
MSNNELIELPEDTAALLYRYCGQWDREYLRTPEGNEELRQFRHDQNKSDMRIFIDRLMVLVEYEIDTVSVKIEKFVMETLRHGYVAQYRILMESDELTAHCLTLEADIDKETWVPLHSVVAIMETMDVVSGCFALDRLIAVARGEPYDQYPDGWVIGYYQRCHDAGLE